MSTINSYLSFNGNCREAMTFYKKCLGGKLVFQTIGESPLSETMPRKMKDCILHCTLTNGNMLLMGSDIINGYDLIKGNAISLTLNCSSEKEIRSYFKKLSASGQPTHPLQDGFWGGLFGGLADKYGNIWMLHFNTSINISNQS